MKARIILALALAGVCALCVAPVHAQSLSLEAAIEQALARHPGLQAEQAAVTAVRRQAELDTLPPALTLGAEIENVLGSGDVAGLKGSEATFRLGRVFELGGKRAARQGLAATDVARQQHRVLSRQLDLAREVTHRFIAVASKQALLDLCARALELSQRNRDAVATRVQRGRSPDSDLALAELAVARAALAHEDAEHELDSARVSLAVLWGDRRATFSSVAGNLLELPRVASFEQLSNKLADGTAQRAAKLESDLLQARQEVAKRSRLPDLHSSFGIRRFEALDDQALVFSFSVPIGNRARAELALARQSAAAAQQSAEAEAAALDAYQSLYGQYQELQHARHQVETLAATMIPQAESALSSIERGYRETRLSFLQVTEARQLVLALQRDQIQAAARYHRLLADIERATAASGASR